MKRGYWEMLNTTPVSRRRALAAAAGAGTVAALALAGCGGDDDGEQRPGQAQSEGVPKPGGTLRRGTTGAMGTLDPHNAVNAGNQQVTPLVYNYLLRYSVFAPERGPVWDLGKSFEQPDQLTMVLRLRSDVVIAPNSKGVPTRALDAEDVKLNVERSGNPQTGSPAARFFRNIERIEAVDPTTARVITKQPYAWVLTNLGSGLAAAIAPREWLGSQTLRTEAVGGGPFTVQEWDPARGALMVKNSAYYDKERPYLDQVQLSIFADQATFRTAFVSGQVDLYGASNSDEADELVKQNNAFQRSDDQASSYQGFWMNTRVAPWNDARVRRALARAINRKEFIALIGRGKGEIIGPVPAGMKPYGLPSADVEKLEPFDVAEARRLFQAANITELTFVHSTAGTIVDYVTVLVRQLQAAGVTAKPGPLEPATWVQGLFRSSHSASHLGTPEFSDPDFAIRGHATGGPIGSGNYDTGFSDQEVDAAIQKAAQTMNEQERVNAYLEAQRLILRKDPAWIPYFVPVGSSLVQPYVRGLERGIGALASAFAKNIWLDRP